MKLVVTGGTGFIGSALCSTLAAAGHEVVVLTRSLRSSSSPRLRDVAWLPGTSGAWEREVDGASGIVNLAGESVLARRWTAAQKRRIVDSRLTATNALVEAIRTAHQKPTVLVNASAIGYYGACADKLLDEQQAPGSDFLGTVCQQWERAARAAEALGVRVVRVRIGLVFACDGGALARMLPPFRVGIGGPLGSGRQWVSWIHRDDLISLIQWVLEHPSVAGPVNATAPNPVTMREFASTLGRTLHRPAVLPVPGFLLRLLLGEISEMLLTGQRVVPVAAQRHGFHFRYPLLAEALAACVASARESGART